MALGILATATPSPVAARARPRRRYQYRTLLNPGSPIAFWPSQSDNRSRYAFWSASSMSVSLSAAAATRHAFRSAAIRWMPR